MAAQADAWATLHEAGAHFVVCGYQGAPKAAYPGWKATRPTLAAIEAATKRGALVGVVPGSLELVVVDADRPDDGPPVDLDAAAVAIDTATGAASLCALATGSGGAHLYYGSPPGEVPNRKWTLDGMDGDIRGTNGYAILWDAVAVAEALPGRSALGEPNLDALPKPPADASANGRTGHVDGNRNNATNADAFIGVTKALQEATERGLASGLPPAEVASAVESGRAGAYRKEAAAQTVWPAQDKPSVRVARFFKQYDARTSDAAPTAWLRSLDGGAWSQRSNADLDRMIGVNMASPGAREAVHLVRGRAHVERYEDSATPWHVPFDWKREQPIAGRVALFRSCFVREAAPLELVPYADRYSAPARASFDPDFGAAAPVYVRFMTGLWGEDPHGYCATWADLVFRTMFGNCEDHVTSYLIGEPGAGKSTLVNLLMQALGTCSGATQNREHGLTVRRVIPYRQEVAELE